MIDPSGNLIWHSVCLEVIMQNPALLFKGREQCCWGIQMQVSLSLSLGFKPSHTHLKRAVILFIALALTVCLKDGSLILYVPAQHTLFPSVPPGETIKTFIEAYRREVTPLTPIILPLSPTLTFSNSQSKRWDYTYRIPSQGQSGVYHSH